MSKEAGHEMSVEQIKEKMAKMPEWMAKCEEWKKNMAEGGEGKCGGFGGMMGMAKEHMKKWMSSDAGKEMMNGKFGGQCGGNPDEMMKKFMGGMMGGKCGGDWKKNMGEWKNKRAVVVNKNHEKVMTILPGQTQFAEIEVMNGTQWPWKQGCFLGMDDAKQGDEETNMPIEPVRVDIPMHVAGNETIKLTVPISVHEHFPTSAKEHSVHMSFRGPHGNTFGERFTFKVIVGAEQKEEQIDDM